MGILLQPVRPYLWAALLAALSLYGCSQPAGGPPQMPPAPVSIVTVEARDMPVTYEYTAQTLGFRDIEVRARVAGILLKRNYEEGSAVKQGQSLFTIDPVPFQVALTRAQADLGVAEARLAQARRELDRLKPVVEARAVSQKELDDATSALHIAEAETNSLRARVNEAKLNLDYTRVEAPITGISGRAAVSEGTLVSGPNVLLTTVTQSDPMYVIFGMPDREVLAMRRDVEAGRLKLPADMRFKARVRLADGTLYSAGGTVGFTDVRVNTQTGTSEARALFPNPKGVLRAGEFVRIVLEGGVRPKAVAVPQRAVLEGPQGKFVYVVDADSKAEARPVKVGDWVGDSWIIEEGIKPGDRLIVDGVMKIGPGAPVQAGDPKGAPAAPGAAAAPGKGAPPAATKK